MLKYFFTKIAQKVDKFLLKIDVFSLARKANVHFGFFVGKICHQDL